MAWNMARPAGKITILVFLYCLVLSPLRSTPLESPFNGLFLDLDERAGEYSFLLGGHLYGEYGYSVFPSASLLANIDTINSSGARFFVSLGDNFRKCDTLQIANFLNSFAAKLQMPLFNAAGNTDLNNRELYEAKFGRTFYSFEYNEGLFVFLDVELDNGNITGEQWQFFFHTLQSAADGAGIKNIFIFTHRCVWLVKNRDYQEVFKLAGFSGKENNFLTQIEPLLIPVSKSKAVFWVSGENGAGGSLPLFYEKDPEHNITYISVGIGDTDKDVLLRCTIDQSGKAAFTPFSLAGQEVLPAAAYGVEYWYAYYKSDGRFLTRYLRKVRRIVEHVYFWAGVFVSIGAGGFILLLFKRRHTK